jgi:hypothetical protein
VETLYKAYKDKAQFFLVYIREAHPSPEKGGPDEQRAKEQLKRFGDKGIAQPKTMDERVIAADKCMKDLKLTIPILLDSIEGDYLKAYTGFQAGTVVIDIDGKIAYWTRGAPSGCKPSEAEAALKKLLSAGGGAIKEKWADVKLPSEKPAKEDTKPAARPAEGRTK